MYVTLSKLTQCWEATVTGGLETGPHFIFETGHCNLKKSALLQMSDLSFCPVYSTLQGGNCFPVSVTCLKTGGLGNGAF